MSLEVLRAVEQVESRAEQIRANAQQEARDVLKKAENQCAAQIADANKSHRIMQKELIEDASGLVAKRLEGEKDASIAMRAQRREKAQQKLPEVAEFICERILDNGSC